MNNNTKQSLSLPAAK